LVSTISIFDQKVRELRDRVFLLLGILTIRKSIDSDPLLVLCYRYSHHFVDFAFFLFSIKEEIILSLFFKIAMLKLKFREYFQGRSLIL